MKIDADFYVSAVSWLTHRRATRIWQTAVISMILVSFAGCQKPLPEIASLDPTWKPHYFVYGARTAGSDFTWEKERIVEAVLDVDLALATKSRIVGFNIRDIRRERHQRPPTIKGHSKSGLMDVVVVDVALVEATPRQRGAIASPWPEGAAGIEVRPDEEFRVRVRIRLREIASKGDVIAVHFPDAVHAADNLMGVGFEVR